MLYVTLDSIIFHTHLSVDSERIRILCNGSSPGWAGAGVLKSIRILEWGDPMRYLMKLVSKGWLPASRACYWAIELQHRGVFHGHAMYVA